MGSQSSRRSKARQRRAAARRLVPIRGRAGRRLQQAGLRSGRVVGVGQFAQGLTRRATNSSGGRLRRWLFAAIPVAVLVIWIAARLTRHL